MAGRKERATSDPGERHGGPGRPRLEFDLDRVRLLAGIQCTNAEIAAVCGCSEDTITRRTKDDPNFAEALRVGREQGKMSLRRRQWQLAMSGHAHMLIWLGKNILGQRDRLEHSGPDGGPIQTQHTVPLDGLSVETKRRIVAELEAGEVIDLPRVEPKLVEARPSRASPMPILDRVDGRRPR